MPKRINVFVYLVAVTLVVFYGQRILSTLSGSGGKDASTLAENAHMAQDAYYSLREVAGVQLGHVLITYRVDEESGRCLPRFSNEACPNLQADPEQLKRQLESLQEELHERILLLEPCADTDDSGTVTAEEGARFRDLFAFGHLAAHHVANEPAGLARAAGLGTEETARNLQDYRELIADCPADIREFFPVVGD